MGSIIDSIECPNCGQEATSDFYYKTGEEYVNCSECGYHYSATITSRDKRLDELTEEDWKIIEIKHPYASYRLKYYDSVAFECGSLPNKSALEQLQQYLIGNSNVETLTISRSVGDEIVKEVIIDNGPSTDSAGYKAEDR